MLSSLTNELTLTPEQETPTRARILCASRLYVVCKTPQDTLGQQTRFGHSATSNQKVE